MPSRCPRGTELLLQQLSFPWGHLGKNPIQLKKRQTVVQTVRQPTQTFTGSFAAATVRQLQAQLQAQQILRLIPGLFGGGLI